MKINWRKPETELEYVFLCMVLWRDICKNWYLFKYHSKFFEFIVEMSNQCSLCEYYQDNCYDCILYEELKTFEVMYCNYIRSDFKLWETYCNFDGAERIYKACQKRVVELIKESNRIKEIKNNPKKNLLFKDYM